jgi:hypothetical protein
MSPRTPARPKSPTQSQAQLDVLAQEFAAVSTRLATLDARVPDARWNARPRPGEWSVAECVAHLNLTSAAMLPRLRAAFAEAQRLPAVGERRYEGAWFGRMLARMVGPVPTLAGIRLGRTKTTAPFVPGSELPRQAVMEERRRWQGEELALVWSADGLPIDRVTIESPFVAGAKYDGYSALWITVRHELRHLVQAERALARMEGR